jgi:hypothetical protein
MKLKLEGRILALAMFVLPLLILLTAFAGLPAAARAQENTDESPHHVTGCLRQGAAANIYTLTDEDGKTWDLRSRTVALAPHVGHTVTATGTIPKSDKSSDDNTPQNHLVVTAVKMVRNNCKPE